MISLSRGGQGARINLFQPRPVPPLGRKWRIGERFWPVPGQALPGHVVDLPRPWQMVVVLLW